MQIQTKGEEAHISSLPVADRKKKKKRNKGRGREIISKLSQGLMMPIAVLPLAGLLLGIGSAIRDQVASNNHALYAFALFIVNAGNFVFGNLAILFAVAIAIAFTRDAGVAALATVVAWACFNGMQSALIFEYPQTKQVPLTTPEYINWGTVEKLKWYDDGPLYDILFYKDLRADVFTNNIGIWSLQTSVFGGMIVGAIVAFLYNKFYQIQLPKVLGFFSGTRFVALISLLAMIPLALLFALIWPAIGQGLTEIGKGLGILSTKGGTNALIFGFIERALIPFGLHHAFYAPLWYTSAGGSMTDMSGLAQIMKIEDGGEKFYSITAIGRGSDAATLPTNARWYDVILQLNDGDATKMDSSNWAGDQILWKSLNASVAGRWVQITPVSNGTTNSTSSATDFQLTFQTFAQSTLNAAYSPITRAGGYAWTGYIDSNNSGHFAFPGVNPGQYQQGKYPFMIFGLPAAAVAMVMAAPKENRKLAGSAVISAGITSFLTGITEPIEFTFLFLAPWLYYGVHAVYCAISFWLMSLLGMNMGMSFSGGLLDFIVYGALPDALGKQANSYWAVVLGLVYIPLYFFTFYFFIKRFDLKTPGRGGQLVTKKDYLAAKDAKNADAKVVSVNSTLTPLQQRAARLVIAYGGKQNIKAANACITKLRIEVRDMALVNREAIMAEGAPGIMQPSSSMLHAVFGTDAEPLKTQINRIISGDLVVDEAPTTPEPVPVPVSVAASTANATVTAASTPTPDASSAVKASLQDEIIVYAPMDGVVRSLAAVPDKTFSDKMMGDGLAILPTGNVVKNPSDRDAELAVAFPGGHAYVVNVAGAPILIHIGIDTVNINASAKDPSAYTVFKPLVKQGTTVGAFAPLTSVDIPAIRARQLDPITPVIAMTEALEHYMIRSLAPVGSEVKAGEPLFKLVLKN